MHRQWEDRDITGEPVVGETLNADTSGITDADGMDGAVFTYRWLADDVALEHATGSGYSVTEADVGKTLAVRVTFTDDAGNDETVTSEATEAVRSSALQLESANVNGATLTLTYNEDLDGYVSVPVSAFTVTVDGNATAVSSVSVSGLVVTLALSTAVGAGDAVTVSYVRPDGPDFIRSTLGNLGESFSGREVTNDTASAQPLEQASPEISSTSTYTVAEGETAVATLSATDVDTPAAELMPGPSRAGRTAATSRCPPEDSLAFASSKDFEAPDDSNSDGTYVVTVQVSDGGRTGSADLDVTLSNVNERPTADAGEDRENVEQGASVTLDGAGTDPDAGDTLGYGWTRSAGPGVTLSTTTAATVTFTAPTGLTATTTLRFTLRVTDAAGLYHEDEVIVTVRGPDEPTTDTRDEPSSPEISSTSTYTVAEGETAVATLTATDGDTPAAELAWSISGGSDSSHFTLSSGGNLAFATSKDFEHPDDSNSDGTYVVTVQVSDGGRTDSADLDVTLSNVNERPTADAGADLHNVEQGAPVTLNGAGTDPDSRRHPRLRLDPQRRTPTSPCPPPQPPPSRSRSPPGSRPPRRCGSP